MTDHYFQDSCMLHSDGIVQEDVMPWWAFCTYNVCQWLPMIGSLLSVVCTNQWHQSKSPLQSIWRRAIGAWCISAYGPEHTCAAVPAQSSKYGPQMAKDTSDVNWHGLRKDQHWLKRGKGKAPSPWPTPAREKLNKLKIWLLANCHPMHLHDMPILALCFGASSPLVSCKSLSIDIVYLPWLCCGSCHTLCWC